MEGKHPCFNGQGDNPLVCFDGSLERALIRAGGQNVGVMFRKDSGSAQTFMFLGTVDKVA